MSLDGYIAGPDEDLITSASDKYESLIAFVQGKSYQYQ